MNTFIRPLPYVLSWSAFALLMIIGMTRVPAALYARVDGEWAKWNVEAILHFGKAFDLSPYSMLAGAGSIYLPNLPWLNPGALALALPLGEPAKDVISYAIYAAELAASIVILARVIGFSWLIATAAAQLHLYLLFPPFSEVFRILNWYSLVPAFAHLTAVLNFAAVCILACGRTGGWRRNLVLSLGFLALFVCGLLSAPFTFLFAMPPYLVIGAVLIVTRRPSAAEWAWKALALAMCLAFFLASGLLDYYLGTIATAARTPSSPVAWDQLLSPLAWLLLFRDYPLCQNSWLLLCLNDRGAWLLIASLVGALLAIFTRRADTRTVAWALLAYIGFAHLYAYAYQNAWLGPAAVLSHHFLVWSSLSFVCMFAVVGLFEPFRLLMSNASAEATASGHKQLVIFSANLVLAALVVVITVKILGHPYEIYRYRLPQLMTGGAAIGTLFLAIWLIRMYRGRRLDASGWIVPTINLRNASMLSVFPMLALVHLSIGVREDVPTARDPSLRNYLREHAAIAPGKPFRGYAATIWIDKNGKIAAGANRKVYADTALYVSGREYFQVHYAETFTEADLWRANIPTFEEYGQWTSLQAHAFALRLLAPPGARDYPHLLRSFTIDPDILRLLGVRYVLTDAESIGGSAILRGSVSDPDAVGVRLFELPDANLATYSPTEFLTAGSADAIAERIRENKNRLDQLAVVSHDIPSTATRARNVAMTVEPDGFRIRAESDGRAYIIVPVQFSHCLVVSNGAPARLTRVNLMQTLLSFEGTIDARIEFRFGLFTDNTCRLRDGMDTRALGLP
jgi:hypothetical protein